MKTTSKEIYEELSTGQWVRALVNRMGYAFKEESDMDVFVQRASVYFQELFGAYHQALAQEASEAEAERVRVVEDITANPERVEEYREQGWSVSKRAKKTLDLDGFLDDYMTDIPKEALAIVKTKLPKELKKELVKYEEITGYSWTVKRPKTAEQHDNDD